MKSFLEVEGIYNPTKRFAFTNITTEQFDSAWDGSPISVPAGVTIELPHHLAVKLTGELVDKIMIGNAKMDEVAMLKANPGMSLPRSPRGTSLGVPAARKEYEDQILRELAIDEESPQVQVMRAQIKAELMADMQKQPATASPEIPSSLEGFADLTNKEAPVKKAPMRVKTIKKPE